MRLQQGDLVKITHPERIYTTYTNWMDLYAWEYSPYWRRDATRLYDYMNSGQDKAVFIKVAPHRWMDSNICLVSIGDEVIMINEAGIEKV